MKHDIYIKSNEMAPVHSLRNNNAVKLTEEQILILQLSDKDIEAGKLISQEESDKNDLEWLQTKS